jgi:hypothetical protein
LALERAAFTETHGKHVRYIGTHVLPSLDGEDACGRMVFLRTKSDTNRLFGLEGGLSGASVSPKNLAIWCDDEIPASIM